MKEKKILIVDDDKFLLDMYQKKFELSDFKAETAATAEEAITYLRKGEVPDIILMDIIMPGIDGLELLKIIKDDGLAPNSLLIMLTNEGTQDKVEIAKSLGAIGYIVKAENIPSEVVGKVLKMTQ